MRSSVNISQTPVTKTENPPNATPTAKPSGMLCTVTATISKTMRRHDMAATKARSLSVARVVGSVIVTVVVATSDVHTSPSVAALSFGVFSRVLE